MRSFCLILMFFLGVMIFACPAAYAVKYTTKDTKSSSSSSQKSIAPKKTKKVQKPAVCTQAARKRLAGYQEIIADHNNNVAAMEKMKNPQSRDFAKLLKKSAKFVQFYESEDFKDAQYLSRLCRVKLNLASERHFWSTTNPLQ